MPRPTAKGSSSQAAVAAAQPAQTSPLVLNSTLQSGKTLLEVSIAPAAEGLLESGRRPADIVCVVDISGSMDSIATEPDEHGECDNLTRLDLVKHSVRTVIAMLKPDDTFGLVTFSGTSSKAFPLTKMDAAGREKATSKVESLETKGTTNLWAGLTDGLEMASEGSRDGCTNAVMLLTDGVPDSVVGLDEVVSSFPNCKSMVGTFGFGYSLNTPLLVEISTKFDGTFTFIPDASFVGTAFVNNTASILSTIAQSCTVVVTAADGSVKPSSSSGKKGPGKVAPTARNTVRIGPCLLGQTRSACFELSALAVTTPVSVAFSGVLAGSSPTTYSAEYVANGADAVANGADAAATRDNAAEATVQTLRLEAAAVLQLATELGRTDLKTEIDCKVAKIAGSKVAADPRIVALLQDLQGQVSEAVSKDEWFNKWGKHYLPSLARSHILQQCTNFKDPGLQVYGLSAVFQAIRDEGDEIFVALPPPTATGRSYGSYGGGGGGHSSAPIDMSRYYNASGGCFKAGCKVTLADGTKKLVENVRQGDVVKTGGGSSSCDATAAVVCAVKTRCPEGVTPLVTLGAEGPTLTQYHPVRSGSGKWAFPGTLAATTMQKADYVYTYLLERGAPSMFIDGVECVTLGHGLDEDVARHAYLGSHAAVTADLKMCPGWEAGLVELEPDSFVRANGSTGEVCAIRHDACKSNPRQPRVSNAAAVGDGAPRVSAASLAVRGACTQAVAN